MTHKLPLQPSESESAQMRADRLTLPIERDERMQPTLSQLIADGRPRIEFTGEKK